MYQYIIHLTCTICTVHGLVNIQVLCIYTCSWIDVCRLCYGTRVTVVCASVCSQSTDFLNMEVGHKVTYTLYMRHKAYVHRRSCHKLEFKRWGGGGGRRVAWPGQSSPIWCCILNSKSSHTLSLSSHMFTHFQTAYSMHNTACVWSAHARRSMRVI